MKAQRRAGLTLVELLIVLAILAIMTTMAVTATGTLLDQSRYDATQRTLQSIREAMIGPDNARDSDGNPIFTGFVADMGRFPAAFEVTQSDGKKILTLDELRLPLAAVPFGIQGMVDNDPPAAPTLATTPAELASAAVRLACGWRGPYLHLSPGTTRLLDGWGNELGTPTNFGTDPLGDAYPRLRKLNDTPAAAGEFVQMIRTLGSNNKLDPLDTDYNTDSFVMISDTDCQAFLQGQVEVQVVDMMNMPVAELGGTVHIRVFGPGGAVGQLSLLTAPTAVTTLPKQTVNDGRLVFSYNLPALPAGPKVIRAYFHDDYIDPMGMAATTPIHARTAAQSIMLRPGSNVKTMKLSFKRPV